MQADHTHLSAYLQPGTILSREDCVDAIDKLMEIVLERDELKRLLKTLSGPMSYGQWSTDFRAEVDKALNSQDQGMRELTDEELADCGLLSELND